MSPATHPEHAAEQAYLERVQQAAERAKERAQHAPAQMADKHAAREARKRMMRRFKEHVDTEALCFGRIDFETGKSFYLGREAVHGDGSELLVINWRMPVAGAFYTATKQDCQKLALRRRFQLEQLRLLGIIDDEFVRRAVAAAPEEMPHIAVDAVASPVPVAPEPQAVEEEEHGPEPHVVDAILADMDRARSSEMRDIVATIEAEQYRLISDALEGILVIQGGPGSGKTAIALHRAAWLLYNHKETLERSRVLVVGPNRAFMEYVAAVLPSLGETSVAQAAVDRLVNLDDVRVRGSEDLEVARLKGDIRMAAVMQRAVIQRVRRPKEDVIVRAEGLRVTIRAELIGELIDRARRGARTYLAARDVFRRELVETARNLAANSGRRTLGGPDLGRLEVAIVGPAGPLDQIWPTVTAPEVLRDLLNSRQRLAAVGADTLTSEEQDLLKRDRARLLREEPWTAADISLLDEADAVIRGVTTTYGYVLADEAQDLSPMQLRMIFRRSADGHATLVGDIAQATGAHRFADWDDLLDAAAVEGDTRVAELLVGYRVPRQIMDVADELLPRVAPQLAPTRAVRDGAEEPRLIKVDEGQVGQALVSEVLMRIEGDRSVGVIAPLADVERIHAAISSAGVQAGDILVDGLARQVTVLSAEQAKGLEFDHVVVVDPAGIAGPAGDWAYVYIALTRATRTLSLIHTTEAPFELPPAPPEPEAFTPLLIEDVTGLPTREEGTVLGARYTEALMQAKFLHAGQRRRGTFTPYLAHLQSVASLVLEDGGTEDEAIAALLHDAVEDHGAEILQRIAEQFGMNVARVVAGCTDPDDEDGRSWRDVKTQHLLDLESAGPEVRRVALAEKLDNARALLRDYRRFEEKLWDRMQVDADDLLWYTTALMDLFVTERPGDMAAEFQDTVERLLDLVSEPEPVS